MNSIQKREFLKWVDNLKDITPPYATLINLIINNFDTIATKGTAQGSRAKFMVEKINAKNLVFDRKIAKVDYTSNENDNIIFQLNRLEVESFRGFKSKVFFDFSKQYSIFYGQNGSGKSSLCQALEYCLLDNIREASVRHIPLNTFINNENSKKSELPQLNGLTVDGKTINVTSNYEKFHFAFIEKNRIDDFAHISAAKPTTQNERLAILFGLSEFTEFVKEFTNDFGRYLPPNNVKSEQLKLARDKLGEEKNKITTTNTEVAKVNTKILPDIISLGKKDVSDIESAINFLKNENGEGEISRLQEKAKETAIVELNLESAKELFKNIKAASVLYEKYLVAEEEFLTLSVDQNLYSLYKAICALEEEKSCPACKTPINSVVTNPYENAKKELKNYDRFEKLKKEMESIIKDFTDLSYNINEKITSVSDTFSVLKVSKDKLNTLPKIKNANKVSLAEKESIKAILEIISSLFEGENSIIVQIENYNKEAIEKNKVNKYLSESKKLDILYAQLIESRSMIRAYNKQLKSYIDTKKVLETQIRTLEKEAKDEKKINTYNEKIISAYNTFYNDINAYMKSLPLELSEGLSEKVTEYYNEINEHDANFEKALSIRLPYNTSSFIQIELADNICTNALQILSEGHLKILGLTILLAKANQMNLPFLIFDDIVNAIDDEHRDGVANLLFKNKDFENIQMVVTCHGEQFVKKIEDKVEKKKRDSLINRFYFLSTECLEERGIVINYSNPKHPLELARINLKDGNNKDAASKCRQATEALLYQIWKKSGLQLTIQLRYNQDKPDSKSLIDALISSRKGDTLVIPKLRKIQTDYNWYLQNKGTHEDDSQSEFPSSDIRGIISLLEEIDDELRQCKYEVSQSEKNSEAT